MSELEHLLKLREQLKTALKTLELELKEKASEADQIRQKIKKIEESLAS